MKAVLASSLLFALAFGAAAAETPSGLIGRFASAPKQVCTLDGRSARPRCGRIADKLVIERSMFGGARDVKVTAEFTTADARLCSFDGWGAWAPGERTLMATDPSTRCELALTPMGRELRASVVRGDQCDSPCAGGSWLEGVVFRKR